MLVLRSLSAVCVLAMTFSCSGKIEQVPERHDDALGSGATPGDGDGDKADATGGAGGKGSGGTDSTQPLGGGAGASSGGSPGLDPQEGSVISEFHFSFAGAPFSNSHNTGAQVVTLVPLPENTVVKATVEENEIVTGVAGSMVFILRDCTPQLDDTEQCTLDIVSFGGSPSGNSSTWDYAFDQRLGTFAKQETFTSKVIRNGESWELPPTDLGLVLDIAVNHGAFKNLNDSGAGSDYIVVPSISYQSQHELIIESFSAACESNNCEVEFSAFLRD